MNQTNIKSEKMKLGKHENLLVKITENYVKHFPEYSFEFHFDNQSVTVGNREKIVLVEFTNSENTLKRAFIYGSIGLGEAYCEGLIRVADKDYKEFLFILIRTLLNKKVLLSLSPLTMAKLLKSYLKGSYYRKETQTENINSHYSLSDWFQNDDDSNQFYLYWLNSKYVQYTCAKWDPETKTLEDAQINKFEFYAKRLGMNENSRGKKLLDLGCGWGGAMFYYAEKYGVVCTGITLSTAQGKYIKDESEKRSMQDQVRVIIENAHNMSGSYDYIISIGMLEHIDDYGDLYKKAAQCLNKGGSALFHAMHQNKLIYKPDPFLLKYIFPGGGLPNIKKNIKIFKKYFNFVEENELPKMSYPKTLDAWYENFCNNEDNIRTLLREKSTVKDIEFAIKMFKHYLMLAYCGLAEDQILANILLRND